MAGSKRSTLPWVSQPSVNRNKFRGAGGRARSFLKRFSRLVFSGRIESRPEISDFNRSRQSAASSLSAPKTKIRSPRFWTRLSAVAFSIQRRMAGAMLRDKSYAKMRSSSVACLVTNCGSAPLKITSERITVRLMMTTRRRSRKRNQTSGKRSRNQKNSGFKNSIWLSSRGIKSRNPAGSYPRAQGRHARKNEPLDGQQQERCEQQVRPVGKERRCAAATTLCSLHCNRRGGAQGRLASILKIDGEELVLAAAPKLIDALAKGSGKMAGTGLERNLFASGRDHQVVLAGYAKG